jgi:hypothetical protein
MSFPKNYQISFTSGDVILICLVEFTGTIAIVPVHSGRMNRLRPFEHWDHGFESQSKHGCLCAFILFVLFCVYVAALRLADHPSKDSYRLCIRLRY